MAVWFENCAKIKVRPSSHQTYRGYIDHHIKPHIGDIPLNKLTTLDLQRLYKKLLSEGRVDRIEAHGQPKDLSPKTVRNINHVISSALTFAKEQRLIVSNPANGCSLPKLEHREIMTLTADQLQAFLREAKESGIYELYFIELATGLRGGELLGLKWEGVDLEQGIIHVRRQVARISGEIVEAPLKTKNSYRTVSIGTDAVEVLNTQRNNSPSEYVFSSPTGGPISPDSALHMLHRVLKRTGPPKVRFHDLRHTFATEALHKSTDIITVSEILGHALPSTTLDMYGHTFDERKRALMAQM